MPNDAQSQLTPPVLSYTSLGQPQSQTLGKQPAAIWMDEESAWSVPTLLAGMSTTEQWATAKTSGVVLPSLTSSGIVAVYFHQFISIVSYTIVGGGTGYTLPTFSYTSYGSQESITLSQHTVIWIDASSPWSTSSALTSAQPGEEWTTEQPTQGLETGPLDLSLQYTHYYTLSFTQSGLPEGSQWSVMIDGHLFTSVTQTLAAMVSPGTHIYNVTTYLVAGNGTIVYVPLVQSGVLDVNGSVNTRLTFINIVPVIVHITKSDVSYVLADKNFAVSISRSGTEIDIVLTTAVSDGPKVLEVNIDSDAFGSVPPTSARIYLKGQAVPQATSVFQMLDMTVQSPLYLLSETSTGYQLLVRIPHFSSNTVQLTLPPTGTVTVYLQYQYLLPVLLLALAVVLLVIAVRMRSRVKKAAVKAATELTPSVVSAPAPVLQLPAPVLQLPAPSPPAPVSAPSPVPALPAEPAKPASAPVVPAAEKAEPPVDKLAALKAALEGVGIDRATQEQEASLVTLGKDATQPAGESLAEPEVSRQQQFERAAKELDELSHLRRTEQAQRRELVESLKVQLSAVKAPIPVRAELLRLKAGQVKRAALAPDGTVLVEDFLGKAKKLPLADLPTGVVLAIIGEIVSELSKAINAGPESPATGAAVAETREPIPPHEVESTASPEEAVRRLVYEEGQISERLKRSMAFLKSVVDKPVPLDADIFATHSSGVVRAFLVPGAVVRMEDSAGKMVSVPLSDFPTDQAMSIMKSAIRHLPDIGSLN
jgi:hypothetical protein